MKKLSGYTNGRDNNFNLIRMIAALSVLITHSFALSLGSGEFEPFRQSLGMTIGNIAVDIFFITSGFLVTASLLNKQNIAEFILARVLRIFPALLIMLVLTVFVLGPAFTSMQLSEYFSSKTTYKYLIKCSSLFFGVSYELPGVFEENIYKSAVNGSLWSLTFEVRMYAILAVSWFTLRTISVRFKSFIVAFAIASGAYTVIDHFYSLTDSNFPNLAFMFFSGASFHVLKDRITLSHGVTLWMFIALIIAAHDKNLFYVTYIASIAYILFYLTYMPAGFIRKYNSVGDYSYGIYIYAFPVQQSISALVPGVSVLNMIFTSGVITLLLSIASWHLVEKRSLKLKSLSTFYRLSIGSA
jgi:peptidoglycan/LPS O-acetylase OafA/YrhL